MPQKTRKNKQSGGECPCSMKMFGGARTRRKMHVARVARKTRVSRKTRVARKMRKDRR